MNVLFLTLYGFDSLQERNIYPDLLREFVKNGHEVYVISPSERREKNATHLIKENHATILRLQIGNTQKTNTIEKGVSTLLIESQYKRAIKKYFCNIKFDLILYSTPPITLVSPIEYIKRRDGAKTYLLLKDIFPQNAIDIGLMSKSGIKGFIYKMFRRKEKRLYSISDHIGCMSKANVDFIIKHNPEINPDIVEICPNSIDVIDKSVDEYTRKEVRAKYNIPNDKKVFIYGGNLGKPQGIPFLIECLKRCQEIEDVYFLIVGNGTEYCLLESYINSLKPINVNLMKWLPKDDYDNVVGACDVGMIFLDHRFSIPNFPSRLISYMQAKIPVLACTDNNTDIGKVIVNGNFGWWCESNSVEDFYETVNQVLCQNIETKGESAFDYLLKHYSVDICYSIIMNTFKDRLDENCDN